MVIERKKLLFALLALIMSFQPVLSAGTVVFGQENPETNVVSAEAEKQVKIAIISDIHYVVDGETLRSWRKGAPIFRCCRIPDV